MRDKKADKFFLVVVLLLLGLGVAVFISASLGVLAKNADTFYAVLWSQLGLGLGVVERCGCHFAALRIAFSTSALAR